MMYRSLFFLSLSFCLAACNSANQKTESSNNNVEATTITKQNSNLTNVDVPNEEEPTPDDHTINQEYAAELKRFVEEIHPNEPARYCDEPKQNSSVRYICTPDWCKSDVNIYEVNNGDFLYQVFSYIPTQVLGVVEYRKEFDSYVFQSAIPYVEKNVTEFNPEFSGNLHLEGKTQEGYLLPWTKVISQNNGDRKENTRDDKTNSTTSELSGNICVYEVHDCQSRVILSLPFKDKSVWTNLNGPENTSKNGTIYNKQYEEEIWTLRISNKEYVNHYPVCTLISTKSITKYGTQNKKKTTDRKLSETVIGKYVYNNDAGEYLIEEQ